MSNRKIVQDVEKCFKQIAIGVEAFDASYDKYEQSTNASQRDKLVENIKKECKKLQRLRDQIKTWAAGNEIKDKGPLQEKRELIESKMEAFKAVEKEMKTKAFSKEGLSASAKMDPKERERDEMISFISDMVEELGRQIESVEAEAEQVQMTTKKTKKDSAKAERLQELEHTTDRHKWHQSKLELLMRALANEDVELDQVKDIQEGIKDYVENNQEVDFYEDDGLYEDLHLEEEEGKYGIGHDPASSLENQSVADDSPESLPNPEVAKVVKTKSAPDVIVPPARRPSMVMKSPLPALATIHTLPTASITVPVATMKPAPPPTKPAGEPLKYASAAAAAAASDKAGVGIAPLPPPTIAAAALTPSLNVSHLNFPGISSVRSSTTSTPALAPAQPALPTPSEARIQPPAAAVATPPIAARSPAPSQPVTSAPSPSPSQTPAAQPTPQSTSQLTPAKQVITRASSSHASESTHTLTHDRSSATSPPSLSEVNGDKTEEPESVFHLPSILQELYDSLEHVRNRADAEPVSSVEHQRRLHTSYDSRPDTFDAEKPRHYRPDNPSLLTPNHYPQYPLPIFDDARLYNKVDTDALFYSFYYRQGTHQQWLAAKALKSQSWRFHKQYQTWFQRHEEPKNITEDYEQGTYRFFDYESTWMNRRKADFKFAYKFLEDDHDRY